MVVGVRSFSTLTSLKCHRTKHHTKPRDFVHLGCHVEIGSVVDVLQLDGVEIWGYVDENLIGKMKHYKTAFGS